MVTKGGYGMFKIDFKNKKSIYEQVIDGIKEEIISGNFRPDDKLPSVRDLAAKLTVNPNTIQKAYTVLEEQGYVYTVSGRGNFVSEISPADEAKTGALFGEIEGLIKQLRYLGVKERDIRYKLMDMTNERGEGK